MLLMMLPMPSIKKFSIFVVALCVALVPAAALSATSTIRAEGTRWSQPRLRIHKGDTVRWTNASSFQMHTVVSYGSNWQKRDVLDPNGGTTTHRFRAVGTYKYRCTEHSSKFPGEPCQGMCGVVKVVLPG